jgi:hypothetical protein
VKDKIEREREREGTSFHYIRQIKKEEERKKGLRLERKSMKGKRGI